MWSWPTVGLPVEASNELLRSYEVGSSDLIISLLQVDIHHAFGPLFGGNSSKSTSRNCAATATVGSGFIFCEKLVSVNHFLFYWPGVVFSLG